MINFGLIRPNYLLPILNSPILVRIDKVKMSLAVFGSENRVFGLDHSLHTRLFQVLADSIGRERLVDDIGKGFGHLDSSFSPAGRDEMLSMVNVGRRKLGGATSNSLWKYRTFFGVKSGYGSMADTSFLCNVFTRVARIQHRKDRFLLSKGKRSDHDGG